MSRMVSQYYPRRARWYSSLLAPGDWLRRRLRLERIRMPPGTAVVGWVVSALVPGWGFCARGRRLWGVTAMGASVLLALIFIIRLGYPAANLALGLLLSIHVTSLSYVLEPWTSSERFRTKLVFGLMLFVGLTCGVYLPVRNLVEHHWLMPLRIGGRVVVVHRLSSLASVHRGDWVAYSFEGGRGEGVYVQEGVGLGPLLALPGDRVKFTEKAFLVNGRPQPSLLYMPTGGEIIIPEKRWFVWPNFDIHGGHGTPVQAVSEAILVRSQISEPQFIGKAWPQWFGRRQL